MVHQEDALTGRFLSVETQPWKRKGVNQEEGLGVPACTWLFALLPTPNPTPVFAWVRSLSPVS